MVSSDDFEKMNEVIMPWLFYFHYSFNIVEKMK